MRDDDDGAEGDGSQGRREADARDRISERGRSRKEAHDAEDDEEGDEDEDDSEDENKARVQGSAKKASARLRECCRQAQAEVISNSSNEIHQTWPKPFSRAL